MTEPMLSQMSKRVSFMAAPLPGGDACEAGRILPEDGERGVASPSHALTPLRFGRGAKGKKRQKLPSRADPRFRLP